MRMTSPGLILLDTLDNICVVKVQLIVNLVKVQLIFIFVSFHVV